MAKVSRRRTGNQHFSGPVEVNDRQIYLKLLAGYAEKSQLQIWAWCLMSIHNHLLAVPGTETSLSCGIGLTNQMSYLLTSEFTWAVTGRRPDEVIYRYIGGAVGGVAGLFMLMKK